MIYSYGIIDSNKNPGNPIKGMSRNNVYVIPYKDIGIAVSNLNGSAKKKLTGSGRIDHKQVLKHEEVVETLMSEYTVLPFRYHTVFFKKEDIFSITEQNYDSLKSNLRGLKNKIEFGIKIIWQPDKVRKNITLNEDDSDGSACKKCPPGRKFMMSKLKKYKIENKIRKEADNHIRVIDGFFKGVYVSNRLRELQTENLLLNAAYLIDKKDETLFKKRFNNLKQKYNDFKYLFSGPWPPYNFCTRLSPREDC